MPELRKDGVTEMLRALVAGQDCVQLRQEGAAELSVLRSRIVGTRTDTRPSRRSGRYSGGDSSEEERGDSEAKRSHGAAGEGRRRYAGTALLEATPTDRLTRSTARGILELCLGPSNKLPRETKLGGDRKGPRGNRWEKAKVSGDPRQVRCGTACHHSVLDK
jgi:hypothetical protein